MTFEDKILKVNILLDVLIANNIIIELKWKQ